MGMHRQYRERDYVFGEQVLALRTRIALTQIELADQIGVHRRSVQNWESGDSYPKAETLQRLISVLIGHAAFTPGNERAEAQALWRQVAQGSPHPLAAFDDIWFGRLAAQGNSAPPPPAAAPNAPGLLRDWGEAPAVPVLLGREHELATLRQWVQGESCRLVAILGFGGIGKSSLAITFAQRVAAEFDAVLFRSLQNGPPLADVLDDTINALSDRPLALPAHLPDKIALLVQQLREQRCLIILDNFESIMQPGAPAGTFRSGYEPYGAFIQAVGEREHTSCLLLTSREKPAEMGAQESHSGPVRTLALGGLGDSASQHILEAKAVYGTAAELGRMAQLYGGNPLALQLVAEPIRELFGGDVGAFLTADDMFFNGVGVLLQQQLARLTPLEHSVLRWLAIERELVPFNALLASLGDTVPQRALLVALESLRRRMLIERAPDRAAFTLQPVILEYLTDQLIQLFSHELAHGPPELLQHHALVQATAHDYVRRSQERLIALPLLERLGAALGSPYAAERHLLALLDAWRGQPPAAQGYGPGNVINLLRLLRGELRGLDLHGLAIRQACFQGVSAQDTRLTGASIQSSLFTEAFDAVQAVAVSASGEYWAAATRRGEVLVWAAGGLTLLHAWRAHTDMIWTLHFSPDAHLLVSGGWDGVARVWDVASGALLWAGWHGSYVNSVAFSPNGRMVASGGNDATVRLWDARTGAELYVARHTSAISGAGVTWSPDSRLLASGDFEGTIKVWAVSGDGTATCVLEMAEHSSYVDGLAFSPSGRTLASASWDGTVKLWDMTLPFDDAQVGKRLKEVIADPDTRIGRVSWSPDERTLAISGTATFIRLWDVEQRRYRATLHGHTDGVCSLAFTPDGSTLLSSGDTTLRVWEPASGRCLRIIAGYADFLSVVDWSPDGAQLVSGGMDRLVRVWDAAGKQPPRTLSGHAGPVCGVSWSPDGRWLASAEWENTIRLWDAASGQAIETLHSADANNSIYTLAWSPDGRRLAAGTSRYGAQIFEMTPQRQQLGGAKLPTPVRQVAWNPDGTRLAGGGDDGSVYVWDAAGRLLQQMSGHHSLVTSLAWSPSGLYLASGGASSAGGEISVWEAHSSRRIASLHTAAGIVSALAWGADDTVLISGGDSTLRWWNVPRGAFLHAQAAHQGTIHSLKRSPDGKNLASCADDGAIVVWELASGQHRKTLRRDRPYERMDITRLDGATQAQRVSLAALGATDTSAALAGPAAPEPPAPREVLGLPYLPTSFVGRGAELRQVAEMLGNPACRLLTLLGPGGIGKTRLALAAAAQASSFTDGVAFVALADVSTPAQALAAIGNTLGMPFAGQPEPRTFLIERLRERHMLLVLDNFEHLTDGADLVYELLARTTRITILVTSRARLDLQAEWLLPIEGLAFPAAGPPEAEQHGAPADYSALQLFVQRASQVQPGFQLNDANLALIIAICRAVAGMPLAIELAVAGLRAQTLPEIAQQLGSSLDVLATTMRDVPARHRSLRAVFDHSWSLLAEPARALWSRLAVFRGGCTPEAASQVAGATLPALYALVDSSLVQVHQAALPAQATDAEHNPYAQLRFGLLEPLREYALERLAARGEQAALLRAHAAFYLAQGEAVAAQWDGPGASAAIAQLDCDYDNIRAALQWARDGGDRTIGLRLGAALRKYWQRRGYYSEGRAWLEELLAADAQPADPAGQQARLQALQTAGWLASDQHDYARAAQLFAQSTTLRQTLGEAESDPHHLLSLARQARASGQYTQAAALLEAALAQQRATGDRGSASAGGLGQSLYDLGLIRRELGDFASAAALFEEGLDLHHAIGEREGAVIGLLSLGDIARDQGNAGQLKTYSEQCLAVARELGIQWAIGFGLNNLALAEYFAGNFLAALDRVRESIALFQNLQADASLGEVHITLGQVLQAQGDTTAARAAFTKALRLAIAVGPRLVVADALEELASIVVGQGRASLAAQVLAAAAALRRAMGTPVRPADQVKVAQALAAAREALGEHEFAAAWATGETLSLGRAAGMFGDELP